MQSSLFQHGTVGGDERFQLQNQQVLAVRLNQQTGPEVLARKGSMVAFQGNVEFEGGFVTGYEQIAAQNTGEGLSLMRCFGMGTVYLAHLAQYIYLLDLDFSGLVVDGQYVLALDPTLTWNVVAIDAQYSMPGVGAYNMEIRGQGRLAVMCSGKPLVMRASHQKEVFADADAVIAWSAGLSTRLEAQATSQRVWRRRGGTGEGWTMSFLGEGYVVVQPSELLPPTQFNAQGGAFGMGGQGYRGNTWGS